MKVDDRGDRLTTLRDKSDGLQTEARHFNDRAGKVRRKMWWKVSGSMSSLVVCCA
jgi:vacuolar-type H+-ATPase subunit D/Vma8